MFTIQIMFIGLLCIPLVLLLLRLFVRLHNETARLRKQDINQNQYQERFTRRRKRRY